ncbi:MAG: aminotransferase class I/II-fold pyridoxal phosphate-dependent enzyme [Gemmatimonadota bacterium]|uniref:aminotransferase class I/II-fold pyridoxal phosphate-dependent enzyme n=1 Tax=Candidatus Palauibacter soopunensis TaxID=3056739 RepID=UPI00239E054C|nr:aminotransferase class I/II-fold pyridoxal phosphate-dependent enzyme [Candidatus Palauibacter soopunensis]MDE2877485.1 aminotransferase class I/II-fold pyridoxal phosphate-dependent enzyme [Candidatus Palauibacter soopunensis]MDE2944104.1 aminotransferase class I/II-fold pyridoxal phosphate-dependent enzyme [Gemmatimonadota bacterium]
MKSRVETPSILAKCRELATVNNLREAGLYPYFRPIEASHDTWVVIEGARKIMVGSNNYMGLTHDPRVLEAARDALNKFGSGNTGSRFLNGNLDLHEQLEAELADFTGMEAALVFSTGYQTNLGTLGALIGRADTVYIDKLDHASLQDGVRLGLGRTRRFNHNDFATLRRMLEAENPGRGKLIAVDGVYSMEGDIADLPTLVELRREYGAAILVDDAHAVGVLGETGAGTAEHWGLTDEVDLILGTFSKSFASIGGFVAGRADVIDYLQHNARALMFSASMPPASAATVLKALEIIRDEPERREQLWKNTYRMMEGFKSIGFDIGPTETPIVPILIGPMEKTFVFWRALFEAGVFTNPVVPPAVPEGSCRLRTSYMATHSDDDLDFVLEQVERVGKKLGVV